jgi:hypothetical protein
VHGRGRGRDSQVSGYAEPRTGGGTGDETETWLWVLAIKKSREGTT